MMQRAIAYFVFAGFLITPVFARSSSDSSHSYSGGAVHVRGYFRNNGTYVQPHYRSAPDHNVWNNWSTKGNINSYTGAVGTHDPLISGHYGYANMSAANAPTQLQQMPTSQPATQTPRSISSSRAITINRSPCNLQTVALRSTGFNSGNILKAKAFQ